MLDLEAIHNLLGIKLGPSNLTHRKYENTVGNFLISYIEREDEKAKEYLTEAARIRKFLG